MRRGAAAKVDGAVPTARAWRKRRDRGHARGARRGAPCGCLERPWMEGRCGLCRALRERRWIRSDRRVRLVYAAWRRPACPVGVARRSVQRRKAARRRRGGGPRAAVAARGRVGTGMAQRRGALGAWDVCGRRGGQRTEARGARQPRRCVGCAELVVSVRQVCVAGLAALCILCMWLAERRDPAEQPAEPRRGAAHPPPVLVRTFLHRGKSHGRARGHG